jgi:RNA polymerase sigma factor (sigma-70 family)
MDYEADSAREKAQLDQEFTLFYKAEMPHLVVFVMVQGARAAAAVDVAQEAMTKAYCQWGEIGSPRAWARKVASRIWWEKNGRERVEATTGTIADYSVLAPSAGDEVDNRHVFLKAVRSLPSSQQEVMAWIYDGYRAHEIADILQKNPDTVRSLLRNARAALSKAYRSGEEMT